jgi:hypothetical protein
MTTETIIGFTPFGVTLFTGIYLYLITKKSKSNGTNGN